MPAMWITWGYWYAASARKVNARPWPWVVAMFCVSLLAFLVCNVIATYLEGVFNGGIETNTVIDSELIPACKDVFVTISKAENARYRRRAVRRYIFQSNPFAGSIVILHGIVMIDPTTRKLRPGIGFANLDSMAPAFQGCSVQLCHRRRLKSRL